MAVGAADFPNDLAVGHNSAVGWFPGTNSFVALYGEAWPPALGIVDWTVNSKPAQYWTDATHVPEVRLPVVDTVYQGNSYYTGLNGDQKNRSLAYRCLAYRERHLFPDADVSPESRLCLKVAGPQQVVRSLQATSPTLLHR